MSSGKTITVTPTVSKHEIMAIALLASIENAAELAFKEKEREKLKEKEEAEKKKLLEETLKKEQERQQNELIKRITERQTEYLKKVHDVRTQDAQIKAEQQARSSVKNLHLIEIKSLPEGKEMPMSSPRIAVRPNIEEIARDSQSQLKKIIETYDTKIQEQLSYIWHEATERIGYALHSIADIRELVGILEQNQIILNEDVFQIGDKLDNLAKSLAYKEILQFRKAQQRLYMAHKTLQHSQKVYLDMPLSKDLFERLKKAEFQIADSYDNLSTSPQAVHAIAERLIDETNDLKDDLEAYVREYDLLSLDTFEMIKNFSSKLGMGNISFYVQRSGQKIPMQANLNFFAEEIITNLRLEFNRLTLSAYGYVGHPYYEELLLTAPSDLLEYISVDIEFKKFRTYPELEQLRLIHDGLIKICGNYQNGAFDGGSYSEAVKQTVEKTMYSLQKSTVLDKLERLLVDELHYNLDAKGFIGDDIRNDAYLQLHTSDDEITIDAKICTVDGKPVIYFNQHGNHPEEYFRARAMEIVSVLRRHQLNVAVAESTGDEVQLQSPIKNAKREYSGVDEVGKPI
ncbi:MAG: hypothetical protein NDI94_03495 [Candidatus Woesearchaeota archaeon]|nr:hypothetical protein [Candidatus Woesearchaeota archaeon]